MMVKQFRRVLSCKLFNILLILLLPFSVAYAENRFFLYAVEHTQTLDEALSRVQNNSYNTIEPEKDIDRTFSIDEALDRIQNNYIVTPSENDNPLYTLYANTAAPFAIGAANMVNDTVLGGSGLILGNLGRGVEAISPFSGYDLERAKRLLRLGITDFNNADLYKDSWLTSASKGVLGVHNYVSDALDSYEQKVIGDNPNAMQELMKGAGALVVIIGIVFLFFRIWIYIKFIGRTLFKYLIIIPYKFIFLTCLRKLHIIDKSSHEAQEISSEQENISSTTDNIDDFTNLYTDIANKLIEIGLARIGRKTTEPNEYLNSALDEERKAVERPFLRILANRYRTDEQRKILAKHFMLFKEMCLFISYHAILKDDAELHETVKTKLRKRLTAGMPPVSFSQRNRYWYELSKKFYEEYSRTQSMPDALTFSFWRTALEKYPSFVNVSDMPERESRESIFAIFEYIYRAIEAEYKKL